MYEYEKRGYGFYRIPKTEADHMRICGMYEDEIRYTVRYYMNEAKEKGLVERKDIILHIMKSTRGHMNPMMVEEELNK